MKRASLYGLTAGLALGLLLPEVYPVGSPAYLLILLTGWLGVAVFLHRLCAAGGEFRGARYSVFALLLFQWLLFAPDYRIYILAQALYTLSLAYLFHHLSRGLRRLAGKGRPLPAWLYGAWVPIVAVEGVYTVLSVMAVVFPAQGVFTSLFPVLRLLRIAAGCLCLAVVIMAGRRCSPAEAPPQARRHTGFSAGQIITMVLASGFFGFWALASLPAGLLAVLFFPPCASIAAAALAGGLLFWRRKGGSAFLATAAVCLAIHVGFFISMSMDLATLFSRFFFGQLLFTAVVTTIVYAVYCDLSPKGKAAAPEVETDDTPA